MTYCCRYAANDNYLWIPLGVEALMLAVVVSRAIFMKVKNRDMTPAVFWSERMCLLVLLTGGLILAMDLRHALQNFVIGIQDISVLSLWTTHAFTRFASYTGLAMIGLLFAMVFKGMTRKVVVDHSR